MSSFLVDNKVGVEVEIIKSEIQIIKPTLLRVLLPYAVVLLRIQSFSGLLKVIKL